MDNRLSSWFGTWHRAYRPILIVSGLAGIVGSVMIYLDDFLLAWLTGALSVAVGAGQPAGAAGESMNVPEVVVRMGLGWPLGLPLFLLAMFVLNRLGTCGVGFVQALSTGRMSIVCKSDLEREVLAHLLRQDDAFFSNHSPAETVNRLAVDLQRISMRRPNLMMLWWSMLLILGNIAFFVFNDWRLAVLGGGGCLAGGIWATTMSRRVKRTDARYLRQDDAVKARFEDYLRAYQEVQVGRLQGDVLASLGGAQSQRKTTYLRYAAYNELVNVGNLMSNLAAFVAMLGVIIYKHHTGAQAAALMLIPVVVHTLPYLFRNTARIIQLAIDYQLSATSVKRMMEYESRVPSDSTPGECAKTQAEDNAAVSITLHECTFQYTSPDGTRQGGVGGVSTTFPANQWVAVCGGAGSGKSTLIKLLLGQLKPQGGQVLFGQTPLEQISLDRRSRLLTLMPQSLALLDTTIEQNLLFGRRSEGVGGSRGSPAGLLSDDDIEVVERAGLGRVCRLKALEMTADFASRAVPGPGPGSVPGPDSASRGCPPGPDGLDGGMPPVYSPGANLEIRGGPLVGDIQTIRQRLRDRLAREWGAAGVAIRPYEQGHADGRHWRLESLLGGRCDRGSVLASLSAPRTAKRLARVLSRPLAAALIEEGRSLIGQTRRLLELDSLHVYSQLAAFPLEERIWQWRRSCRHLADGAAMSTSERLTLCLIGLTGALGEQPGGDGTGRRDAETPGRGDAATEEGSAKRETQSAKCQVTDETSNCLAATRSREAAQGSVGAEVPSPRPSPHGEGDSETLDLLKDLIGPAWQPFDVARVHPYLTWRENLVFGIVEAANSRSLRLVDQALLQFIEDEKLAPRFTRIGLRFRIGRLGGNLSGGQGQLVALCRALLRGTAVLVLDEPTSALDPASRARVAELLGASKAGRLIITISHDAEFIRQADEVRLMDNGRLAGAGTFEQLGKDSEIFRKTLRQT